MLQKRCTSQQTLHFLCAAAVLVSAREKNILDEQRKNALMQFMRGYSAFRFSIQFPSLIALVLIQSLPCAWCGPDTTDLRVCELPVKVIQESFSKGCQGEVYSFTFPSNKEEDRAGLKAACEERKAAQREYSETRQTRRAFYKKKWVPFNALPFT